MALEIFVPNTGQGDCSFIKFPNGKNMPVDFNKTDVDVDIVEFLRKKIPRLDPTLPEGHRRRMWSTNMLERFNSEIRRRTRVVRIFPNETSCVRLMSALRMEMNEEWMGRKYLTMEEQIEQRQSDLKPCEVVA